MLKLNPTTRNITIKLLVPSLLPRRDVEGGNSEALLNYYNLLLYIVAATSASMLFHSCYYKLLADSSPMLQDSSEDASLR